jgi:hypothetical protein
MMQFVSPTRLRSGPDAVCETRCQLAGQQVDGKLHNDLRPAADDIRRQSRARLSRFQSPRGGIAQNAN